MTVGWLWARTRGPRRARGRGGRSSACAYPPSYPRRPVAATACPHPAALRPRLPHAIPHAHATLLCCLCAPRSPRSLFRAVPYCAVHTPPPMCTPAPTQASGRRVRGGPTQRTCTTRTGCAATGLRPTGGAPSLAPPAAPSAGLTGAAVGRRGRSAAWLSWSTPTTTSSTTAFRTLPPPRCAAAWPRSVDSGQ